MRRIVLLLVAVMVLAGCRITTVLYTPINAPDGVERHASEDVVAVACDFDSFWFGPGVVLIHPDGSSGSFVSCRLPEPFGYITSDLSPPGTAADGTVYVATDAEDLPEASSQILALNPATGALTSVASVPGRVIRSVTVGPGGEIFYGSAPLGGSFGISSCRARRASRYPVRRAWAYTTSRSTEVATSMRRPETRL